MVKIATLRTMEKIDGYKDVDTGKIKAFKKVKRVKGTKHPVIKFPPYSPDRACPRCRNAKGWIEDHFDYSIKCKACEHKIILL